MNNTIPEPGVFDGCGSWIVTKKSTGEVVGEFGLRSVVEKVNQEKYLVELSRVYLERINGYIANLGGKATREQLEELARKHCE